MIASLLSLIKKTPGIIMRYALYYAVRWESTVSEW